MTPLQYYRKQVSSGKIAEDPQQLKIMQHFEHIYHQLIKRQAFRDSYVGQLRRKIKPRPPIKGLYLWGKVGVGKTYLMDSFFHCLPVKKMRMHFHPFMQMIHNQLAQIQGQTNPLQLIAKQIADQYIVICFDEFVVTNIADAMILGELFKALLKRGLCLVTSSNIAPDDLYKRGIQRQRFLPAISLIKQYTTVINLDSEKDYRLRHLEQSGVYYTPLNQSAQNKMELSFTLFSKKAAVLKEPIQLFGRSIAIQKQAGDIIWFDFMQICGRPRSQKDYLALAKQYKTILISEIPKLRAEQVDLMVSFINLIDILYDAKIRVIISAEGQPADLYLSGHQLKAYQRTISRLIEMQSKDYVTQISSDPLS